MWRCLKLFPSLPQSNKFTQRRGTAPTGPGKDKQEEGDEREGQGEEDVEGEGGGEEEERKGGGRA